MSAPRTSATRTSSTRTQVYFTEEQRRRIDVLATREGVTLAEVVRRALDSYLDSTDCDPESALDETFGADLNAYALGRDEWVRG